jgi:multidrug efflux system membrane fusion protein
MNGSAQYQEVANTPSGTAPPVTRSEGHAGWWIAGLLVAAGIVLGVVLHHRSAANNAAAADNANKGMTDRVIPVTATTVKKKDVPIVIEGLGTVTPLRTMTVRTLVNGTLMNVYFKEGQDVRQGDLLAQVDPRPFEVQLHQGEAALAKDTAAFKGASRDLARDKTLLEQKLVAQQVVDDQQAVTDEAQAAMMADNATIEQAKLNLTYARITAPANATTGIRQVDPGNIVQTSDPSGIVMLTQMDPTSVIFTLPQDYLPDIQREMLNGPIPVEVFTRDGSKSLGTGNLTLIDNQVNTSTAMIRLRAQLPNPHRTLWPNQFVKAQLHLQTLKGVVAVRSNVVQQGPSGTYAYVVTQDKSGSSVAEMRPVTVETTAGDYSVISKGLEAGDKVVEDGQFQLKPGAKVSVTKPAKEGAVAAAGAQ